MNQKLKESIEVIKDGVFGRTPFPEIGKLLQIVYAVNSGNTELAEQVAESFSETSKATRRALTQWLGSDKYQAVAVIALTNDSSFTSEAILMLPQTKNQNKRFGLLQIICSSDQGEDYLSRNLNTLQSQEQEQLLQAWIWAGNIRTDLLAIKAVEGNEDLSDKLTRLFTSEKQPESSERFNRLVEHALTANDESSLAILRFADSIYTSWGAYHSNEISNDTGCLMDSVLSNSTSYDNEILEFCVNKRDNYPMSLRIRALTDVSIYDKSRARLVSDLNPIDLPKETVIELAEKYFFGNQDKAITEFAARCYSTALLLDWVPPGLNNIVIDSLENPKRIEDPKILEAIPRVNREIFDCDPDRRGERISKALVSDHPHLADLALKELDSLDGDHKIEALKSALIQESAFPRYQRLMLIFLGTDPVRAVKFSVGMTTHHSERVKEKNEEFLIKLCATGKDCRELIRSAYKACKLGPSEWGLRTTCSIGVCHIEETLNSKDLSGEDYALVPSTIVGNPAHFSERGFKFGYLSSKDLGLIQVQLPETYAKDVIVGTHYVLCTDELIPLARIYPDPEQGIESLVFEPFPYSADEVKVQGTKAEKLRTEWFSSNSDSLPEPYISQELRLKHGRGGTSLGHTERLSEAKRDKGFEEIEEMNYQSFLAIQRALSELMVQSLAHARGHRHTL